MTSRLRAAFLWGVMGNYHKCAFVRACLRDNILPIMRLDRSMVSQLDRVVLEAVENIRLEEFSEISPSGVAAQLSGLLERAVVPGMFEFFAETSKWRRLNKFGFQRKPGENGMVPILVYSTNHFAVAELVREAARCYDVLHPSYAMQREDETE